VNLSVIICTYNRERYIYRLLCSLAEGDYPRDGYEIVWVDNNSTDGSAAEAARFAADHPDVRLHIVRETSQGLSYARNRGIAEAAGDILVYVDDDATVNSAYLSTYARFFAAHPEVDAAGGPIIPAYEQGSEPRWMTHYVRRLLTGYLWFGDKAKPFPGNNYPGGGNAAYRRTVFERVGLYNVSLGRNGDSLAGGEEKDIFRKMTAAGMTFWYLPDAVLYHSIPPYKLQEPYFDRLTRSIGDSERLRTLAIGPSAYRRRLLSEGVKWCGTLVLAVSCLLTLRPAAARKLVRFRLRVTQGLLGADVKEG